MPQGRQPIIECVPNFSEGRNPDTIRDIVKVMQSIEGAQVLHVDMGYDANRTVVTIAGSPEAVFSAAEAGIATASEKIDMKTQRGEHPRMGAVDVCPFVPLRDISAEELILQVDKFAARVAKKHNLPIYLYAHSARMKTRESLSAIRKGQYEGLREKLRLPGSAPDFGPKEFQPSFGAMAMGVREVMIAYNIHLKTKNVKVARHIARELRESGGMRFEKGRKVHLPGEFRDLKAIGWSMPSYGWAQVSMNVMDYKKSPLHEVYEAAKQKAKRHGTAVQGSELIGLAPRESVRAAGMYYAQRDGLSSPISESQWLKYATEGLGLDRLYPLDLSTRIIEDLLDQPPKLDSLLASLSK
ncbi:MAG: glutamate formimidoyltransferase [Bacteroidetes bacterium]|jgi:glutamate formiminotransferase/formiminotetrahydrofolate cyclodeaminase|nr:glutamate formimidoyltransferase [Bacteroidota bacterium]